MKKIILVRHGKAIDNRDDMHDFKRTLIHKGEKESELMARAFKKESFKPDLIISSPADRALETAHIYARKMGYPVQHIHLEDSLYSNASVRSLLDIVRAINDEYVSVFLFGHNPSISDFAMYLLPEFSFRIPKSGVVGMEFPVASWKEIQKGTGQIYLFDYPITKHQKMQAGETLDNELREKLKSAVEQVLDGVDSSIRKKMDVEIQKKCRKLSKQFVLQADHLITQTISAMKLHSSEDDEETPTIPKQKKKKKSQAKSQDAVESTE